jgi:hypothetical protein
VPEAGAGLRVLRYDPSFPQLRVRVVIFPTLQLAAVSLFLAALSVSPTTFGTTQGAVELTRNA